MVLSLLSTLGGLIAAYALTLHSPSGVYWFAGQAIGQTIGAIYAWRKLQLLCLPATLPKVHIHAKDTDLMDTATFLSFCVPLSIATGLMWVQLSGYRLGFEVIFGLKALGFVAVAFGLANQVFALFETLAMQYVYPNFYQAISQNNKDAVQVQVLTEVVNFLLPIYILLAICATVAAPAMLKLLTSSQYHNAYYLVMAGVVVELCRVTSNLFSLTAQITQKTSEVVAPYALGALVLVATTALGYKLNAGVMFFGIGLFFSALSTSLSMYFIMRRLVPFAMDFTLIFPMLGLLAIVELCCSFALLVPASVYHAILIGLFAGGAFSLGVVFLLKRQSCTNHLFKTELPLSNR